MPRPRRCRRVLCEPGFTYFKPAGVRISELEDSVLTVDEYEAIRLKDLQGLGQEQAAKKMNVSQPTFHRLLLSARKKISDAIVNGKAIRIQGGTYKMVGAGRGLGRGAGRGGGRGLGVGPRGRRGGFGLGPSGECICPKCGYKQTHTRGVPCYELKCPKCGAAMTRA